MNRRLELTFVALLVALGVLLKFWFVHDVTGGDFGKIRFSDEATYYVPAANQIAAEGLHYFLTERSLWNGPLNPLWIYVLGQNFALVKICNTLLISIAGIFLWGMLRRRSVKVALFALFIWNIYPPLVDFGPTLLTEPPFLFLVALAFWAFSRERCFLSGILLGLATLVRPTTQLFPIFLLAAACLPFIKIKKQLLQTAIGMLLLIVPYVAKNYLLFGRATVANGFGAVFQLGTNLRTYGDEPIYYGIDFDTQRYTKEFTHLDSEGDKRLSAAAVSYIKNHPVDVLGLILVKPFKFLLGSTRHYFFPYNGIEAFLEFERDPWRIFLSLSALAITPIVTILGIFNLVGVFRKNGASNVVEPVSVFSALVVLYFIALHAIVFPIPRMALPVFLILLFNAAAIGAGARNIGLAVAIIFQLTLCFGSRNHLSHEYCSRYPTYFDVRHSISTEPISAGDVEIKDGAVRVIGKDPFVVFKADAATDRNQLVLIELEVLDPPKRGQKMVWGQLFWSASDTFLEEQSAPFLFRTAPGIARYRISVTFNKYWHSNQHISRLRLDLGERVRGLTVKLKAIEIVR